MAGRIVGSVLLAVGAIVGFGPVEIAHFLIPLAPSVARGAMLLIAVLGAVLLYRSFQRSATEVSTPGLHSRRPSPRTAPVSAHASEPYVPRPQDADKVFLPPSVTGEYLVNFYTVETSAAAQAAVAIYLGKWMHVSARIRDVSLDTGVNERWALVHLEDDVRHLVFQGDWIPRVESLRRGDMIDAIGRLDKVQLHGVRLVDAELVDRPVPPI